MKSFYTWLQKKYAKKDGPKGNLAEDTKDTRKSFSTRSKNKESILSYLYKRGACRECLAAFNECWFEYELEELGVNGKVNNRWAE